MTANELKKAAWSQVHNSTHLSEKSQICGNYVNLIWWHLHSVFFSLGTPWSNKICCRNCISTRTE